MCCWVSGWLSIFQKNECLHLQGEEAKPILWYVRIHSPNTRASHPAVPKCSEAQIFQIHFFKNAVELCYFLFEILTVTCHIETNIVELWIVALVVWYVGFKVSDEPIVTCCRYSATREHGVISQKATKWIFALSKLHTVIVAVTLPLISCWFVSHPRYMKNMNTGIQTIGMRYHGVTVMYSNMSQENSRSLRSTGADTHALYCGPSLPTWLSIGLLQSTSLCKCINFYMMLQVFSMHDLRFSLQCCCRFKLSRMWYHLIGQTLSDTLEAPCTFELSATTCPMILCHRPTPRLEPSCIIKLKLLGLTGKRKSQLQIT